MASGGVRGISETPVQLFGSARESGARLARVVTDRDQVIDLLSRKRIDRLGRVLRDVHSRFLHRLHGKWVDVTGRLGACAQGFELLPGQRTQESFGHVAATGVAGTKKQDACLRHKIDWAKNIFA